MSDDIIGVDLAKDMDFTTFVEKFFDVKLNKWQTKFVENFNGVAVNEQ